MPDPPAVLGDAVHLHGHPEPLAQHASLQQLLAVPQICAAHALLGPAADEGEVAPATERAVQQAQGACAVLGAVICCQRSGGLRERGTGAGRASCSGSHCLEQ